MSKRSWDFSADWYHQCVEEKGHHYHQTLILPELLKWIGEQEEGSFLDLGCGQGVLARKLPKQLSYVGIDSSEKLLQMARKMNTEKERQFLLEDLSKEISLQQKDFDWACFLLSLQNIEHPEVALKNASIHLKKEGKLILVLNHPCYRIPRQSSWGIDEKAKLQYRRVQRYLSSMEIPIQTNPSKNEASVTTYSYHFPLSLLFSWLQQTGFVVLDLKEWCSNKKSEGSKAKMEERARKEIPLFLAILAEKK